MKQQVNLLAPMFRKQRALFSSQVCVIIIVIFALALGAIYAAFGWRASMLASEQARLAAERDRTTARLNELAAQMQGKGGAGLDKQVEALTAERDRKQQAMAALSRKELGNTQGFSAQFTGLARSRLNGLWLTKVEVSAAGASMALSGVALSEELLPKYLSRLGGEAVFAGTSFEEASLKRRADGGAQLDFVLRSDRKAGAP